MTANRPRYSILIPTRNGIKYLPYAIDSVLSQSSQDFELIVSDNHSKDGTAEYLATLTDPRLIKLKPEAELPMASHFEFILSHAQGDWVTALGDDDAVMPFFFTYLDSLNLNSLDAQAIVFRRAYYFWDGCQELYGDRVVDYQPSGKKGYVNNNWALFLALSSITSYMELPQLYTTGLVRSDFVKSIKEKSGGKFFHGTSPDASSAAIMATNVPRHFRIEQPIFWTGTSPKSVGFSQGSSSAKERLNEFMNQNDANDIKASSDLRAAIEGKLFLSEFLYDALLVNQRTPKLWTSTMVRNFYAAGLVLTGGATGRKTAHRIYRGRLMWLSIAPFILTLSGIKLIHILRQALIPIDRRRQVTSNNRENFPTIAYASQAAFPGISVK